MTRFMTLFHHRQAKLFNPLAFHGKADQPTGMLGHEIDGFRGGVFSQNTYIALIFAVFIIDKDEHLPAPGSLNDFIYIGKASNLLIVHTDQPP